MYIWIYVLINKGKYRKKLINGYNKKKILRNFGNICNKCYLGRINKYFKVVRINNNCIYYKLLC